MILSGKTVTVVFADGRRETITISQSDELRFEQSQKTSLTRILSGIAEGDGVPLWVIAGIVHWRLLRSDVENIPQGLDEFIDMLEDGDWLEVLDEGKAEDSDPTPSTG